MAKFLLQPSLQIKIQTKPKLNKRYLSYESTSKTKEFCLVGFGNLAVGTPFLSKTLRAIRETW